MRVCAGVRVRQRNRETERERVHRRETERQARDKPDLQAVEDCFCWADTELDELSEVARIFDLRMSLKRCEEREIERESVCVCVCVCVCECERGRELITKKRVTRGERNTRQNVKCL